jgi:hypothetical protein
MVGTLSGGEEAQLLQTIEMFEVITQSQPQDVQSLEILKEAYLKLGREKELIAASKRIAQAYVAMGQFSSAILEYEGILQRFPEDAETLAALGELESKANPLSAAPEPAVAGPGEESPSRTEPAKPKLSSSRTAPVELDDGKQAMHKMFVEGKVISAQQFEASWVSPDLIASPTKVIDPFVQVLAEQGHLALDKSLRLISDKGRVGFLPLERYDVDIELARSFPKETLFRWCILPFDRMSKSILVATTNPFNKQAASELEEHTKQRLLWYLAPPDDISKALRKIIR